MQGKTQYLENMNRKNIIFYEFAKKTTQIILPFSLFSLVFLHASWFPFINYLVSNMYTFYFQIVSLACDKNYIFLLCNGIVVFVAKYSCRTFDTYRSPFSEGVHDNTRTLKPSFDEEFILAEDNVVDAISVYDDEKIIHVDEDILENEEVQEDGENECAIENEEDQEEERPHENYFRGDEKIYYVTEDNNKHNYMFEDEEEEEEEEEAITKMSAEELTRKFDDFIRKMKDELRFEARQQLIAV